MSCRLGTPASTTAMRLRRSTSRTRFIRRQHDHDAAADLCLAGQPFLLSVRRSCLPGSHFVCRFAARAAGVGPCQRQATARQAGARSAGDHRRAVSLTEFDHLGNLLCGARQNHRVGAMPLDREGVTIVDRQLRRRREHVLAAECRSKLGNERGHPLDYSPLIRQMPIRRCRGSGRRAN